MNNKRALVLLLVALMVLTQFACGKNKNAEKVDTLIGEIGTVTLDSEDKITAAEAGYDALTDKEKEQIERYEILVQAREEYDVLAAEAERLRNLTSEKWINIYNDDAYQFNEDGTGTHASISIKYTFEGDELMIMEGAAATEPKKCTVDFSGDVKKITPEDSTGGYYVTESDYKVIGEQIKDESIKTLMSVEFWSAQATVNYLQFQDGGWGWFIMPGRTDTFQWEMISNNTVKLTALGNTISLIVISDPANPMLVNAKTMVVTYKPKI